jgi:hypothetical protein
MNYAGVGNISISNIMSTSQNFEVIIHFVSNIVLVLDLKHNKMIPDWCSIKNVCKLVILRVLSM